MVVTGIMLGTLAAMSGPFVAEQAATIYDDRYPVWRNTTATVQERRGNQVVIELTGTKARDCRFLRINAQTLHPDGMRNAKIRRVDDVEHGVTRPLGTQNVGMFLVVPAEESARAIVVTVEHLCGERTVLGHFATVRLRNE